MAVFKSSALNWKYSTVIICLQTELGACQQGNGLSSVGIILHPKNPLFLKLHLSHELGVFSCLSAFLLHLYNLPYVLLWCAMGWHSPDWSDIALAAELTQNVLALKVFLSMHKAPFRLDILFMVSPFELCIHCLPLWIIGSGWHNLLKQLASKTELLFIYQPLLKIHIFCSFWIYSN